MFLRAVDDRSHAFLHGHVLRVDAGDTGKGPSLLNIAVDEEIVGEALFQAPIGPQIVGAPTVIGFLAQHVLAIDGNLGIGGIEEIEHRNR